MILSVVTAHAGASTLAECRDSWLQGTQVHVNVVDGTNGMLAAYEAGWRDAKADVIAFLHDDCVIREKDWVERVLAEFEDPKVGLCGLGGALVHGSDLLYRSPYDHRQLGRGFYRSNVDDAEVHGERFTGSCEVAVLDGFALVVRREFLALAGGWPVDVLGYIAYDYWICCMAHRLGYRTRLVGVRCHHYGGRTAVALNLNTDTGEAYQRAHRFIAKEFSDVLPYRVIP